MAKEKIDRLLDISKAAQQLQVASATLRRWADRGLVNFIRLPNGYRKFRESEVRAILESRRGVIPTFRAVVKKPKKGKSKKRGSG